MGGCETRGLAEVTRKEEEEPGLGTGGTPPRLMEVAHLSLGNERRNCFDVRKRYRSLGGRGRADERDGDTSTDREKRRVRYVRRTSKEEVVNVLG